MTASPQIYQMEHISCTSDRYPNSSSVAAQENYVKIFFYHYFSVFPATVAARTVLRSETRDFGISIAV